MLLGLLFALSNASFIYAIRTLIGRFEAPSSQVQVETVQTVETDGGVSRTPSFFGERLEKLKDFGRGLEESLEPWLPRFGQPMTTRQMFGLLLFLPILVSIRASADYLSNYCMGWVSERVVRDMRLDLMSQLSRLSLEFYNRFKTGDLLIRINQDTQNLLRGLRIGAADLVKESLTVITVFVTLCLLMWKLTLLVCIILPVCMIPMIILGKKTRRATRAGMRARVGQSSQLVELLSSIRIVKAFGLEAAQLARFRKTSSKLVAAGMKGIQAKQMVNPVIEVVSMLGLSGLLIYVFQSGYEPKDLAAFLTGVILFLQPVKKLAGLHILFEQAGVAVQRLGDLMNETPAVKDPSNPKQLGAFKQGIQFDHVTFGYGKTLVLRDFSVTIPRGHRLGLAGESGCGKTTILNLLYRFFDPYEGRITFDGIDLRDVSAHDLRSQMALVSQDVVIFDQSVAENIACGKLGATQAEVEAAGRAAFAHDFIQQLPEGYNTQVGERGVTLSGGQRQRIAIARAFVRNAPILVLDEATASLDSKAEAEVQADIERLAEHRTVICVAHRLSTLASMDQIIVLEKGQIVETGSFDELLNAGGNFAAMAAKQGIQSRME
jgi:subfamily B ATP-binding cassette protein MsbA